jgi:exodeoxyribonuclease VII small subunit
MSDDDDQAPPPSFEQALDGLDDIVTRLESGEIGLEEAVGLFEQGQRYLAMCRERLNAAQGRIDELTAAELPAGADDTTGPEPF